MKTFIAATLFGVLICATLVFASSAHTGHFWDRLSSSAKYGYVNGYSEAMSFSIAELGGLKAAPRSLSLERRPGDFPAVVEPLCHESRYSINHQPTRQALFRPEIQRTRA